MQTDVLIVGAGPSGLALANVLAVYGVDFRIVDSKSGPAVGSRANVVHVRTLELLDRLGLAERAVAQGVKLRHVEIYERGRPAAQFPLAGRGAEARTPYPFALGLSQYLTEQLLATGMAEQGGSVEWDTEFLSLCDGDWGVTAVVSGPDGIEEAISARWMVAADGAHSPLRHALGLSFPGSTYEQSGLLADVDLEMPAGTRLAADRIRLNFTRGGFVGMIGLGERRYRLFGALPPGLTGESTQASVSHDAYAHVRLDDIQRWFEELFVVPATVTNVVWSGLFHVHSRVAERFRAGNVFLIGDAAHIHSPAGGQGLNLGIGDAVNLGWKLALVAHGQAHDRLLDSYEAERYAVAKAVLRGADRGFTMEATNDPVVVWLRANVVTRLIGPLSRLGSVRGLVFKLLSQTWINYRGSPVVAGRRRFLRGRLQPGDRVIHGRSGPVAGARLDIARHHLVLFQRPSVYRGSVDRRAIEEVLRHYGIEVAVRLVRTSPRNRNARKPVLYLIRPDGHIGYTGPAEDLDGLSAYLDKLYTPIRLKTTAC